MSALYSGELARQPIPERCRQRGDFFLDEMQVSPQPPKPGEEPPTPGINYYFYYVDKKKSLEIPTGDSAAVYQRLYLGWRRDNNRARRQ